MFYNPGIQVNDNLTVTYLKVDGTEGVCTGIVRLVTEEYLIIGYSGLEWRKLPWSIIRGVSLWLEKSQDAP